MKNPQYLYLLQLCSATISMTGRSHCQRIQPIFKLDIQPNSYCGRHGKYPPLWSNVYIAL